ncbi:hypothetical protein SNE40_013359 [Patella caerulea]|uniref:Uncharacterized protein n=1 Tax=Patella caerulea TaxID=87958 RepID=A0AAN8JM83_PATCE
MSTKINPPCLKSKEYELYKQELLAWKEVTELAKSKQGVAIALTLPEDDSIRQKVFDQIPLTELKIGCQATKHTPTAAKSSGQSTRVVAYFY